MHLVLIWYKLNVKLRQQAAPVLPSRAGKVTVKGSNANVSHTINEDERSEFTHHINSVSPALYCGNDTDLIVTGFGR